MGSEGGISYWVMVGAVMMALGVMAGAFGAHALRTHISPEDLAIYQTAVLYHLLHAVALVAIGALLSVAGTPGPVAARNAGAARMEAAASGLSRAAAFLLFGLWVFSGSLYAMVLSGERWLGMITPIGGVAMIVGWFLLALAARPRHIAPSP